MRPIQRGNRRAVRLRRARDFAARSRDENIELPPIRVAVVSPPRSRADRIQRIANASAVIITIVVSIAALIAAFVVPDAIDRNATARSATQQCSDSVSALRTDLTSLRRGYNVDPSDKPARLADWSAATGAAEQVPYACEDLFEEKPSARARFEVLSKKAYEEGSVAYEGLWLEDNTNALISWTAAHVGGQ